MNYSLNDMQKELEAIECVLSNLRYMTYSCSSRMADEIVEKAREYDIRKRILEKEIELKKEAEKHG